MDKYLGLLLDNRYEILEVIGTGGMAVVYRARCRLLNRYVAIKILKDEFASDADFRRRFHTEAQAVAKLQHHNIVSVHDVNRTDNIEYIVMELVEGITLKEYMEKKGVLSQGEFLHFAPQIAHALEHAHARGIIHRDIKPQNIIILRDGSLKVTDFGIARFAQSQQITITDEALGSVHYVSPEQARGSQIDARSDIYSFGVMMYEMLTGRLPFEGDTPVAVVLQHINSIPLQPREIDPSIPPALEEIIMHAMAPNVDRRYPSATAILKDFERYQKDPNVVFGYASAPVVSSGATQKFGAADVRRGSQDKAESPNKPGTSEKPAHAGRDRVNRPYSDDDDYEPYMPRRRTSILVYIITGILTAAIFLGGAAFIITTIFSTSQEAVTNELTAPHLVGKSFLEVLQSVEYGGTYNIVEGGTSYSDTIPEGIIIDQKPASGRSIKPDTEISVIVSLGPKKVALPELTNVEYRTAQLRLSSLDFMYTNDYEVSDTIPEGYVIRTEPAALTLLTPGTVVKLVISMGRDQVMTAAPDLFGYTEERAQRVLEAAGLVLGETIPMESTEPEGTVIAQSVAKDTAVPEKTTVDIYVAYHAADTLPDATESSDATEPSGTTSTGAQDTKGSYVLAIRLPSDKRSKVTVTVKSGSETLHEQEYETSLGLINITLKGTGSILATVYFDGEFYADQVVIFD